MCEKKHSKPVARRSTAPNQNNTKEIIAFENKCSSQTACHLHLRFKRTGTDQTTNPFLENSTPSLIFFFLLSSLIMTVLCCLSIYACIQSFVNVVNTHTHALADVLIRIREYDLNAAWGTRNTKVEKTFITFSLFCIMSVRYYSFG